jgi:magnesium-transporting ATPase (P-type)
MFSATGWDLVEAPGQHPVARKDGNELTIIKRHEFDHARATMSVIVKDAEGECVVYCKVPLTACSPEFLITSFQLLNH